MPGDFADNQAPDDTAADDTAADDTANPSALTLQPIGIVRSPFAERMSAPRQPRAAQGIQGTLELYPHLGYEHALEDLSSFRFIWVLFWFHKNQNFRRKVLPPRSQKRRGVFATRSPYRPNPLGLSAVELLGVEGLKLHVQNLDILDGTPIFDLKPYIPYTDAIPQANSGWLDEAARPVDPIPRHEVAFTPRALAQLDYLAQHAVLLAARIEEVLRLGPTPHPYRRIKPDGAGFVLAYKAWRVDFTAEKLRIEVRNLRTGYRRIKPDGAGFVLAYKAWRIDFTAHELSIEVQNLRTGYRPSVLANGKDRELDLHRAFVERFG